MILFKREVFAAMDLSLLSQVCDTLSQQNITFCTKAAMIGRSIHGRSMRASVGEDLNYKTIYYIYTRKNDAELASKVIRDTLCMS